jgi:hypothetical protein
MPVTKTVNSQRTVVEYTVEEFKEALGLEAVLAVYIVNGNVEVVTESH